MELTSKAGRSHIVVCGNEKGGSGKTTTIVHLAIALLNAGYRVATIDLDCRQKSFTRYLNNRKLWSLRNHLKLEVPDHFVVSHSTADRVSEREAEEVNEFCSILEQVENTHSFILIDTPGHDGHLMRLAHSMADTLITPLNDSFIDFDVLGQVCPETGEIMQLSHYSQTVREARRYRNRADDGLLDWIVVRNRLTHVHSNNKDAMMRSLRELSLELGCRLAEGISERMIFRELFPMGLTALDELDQHSLGGKAQSTFMPARHEVRSLISTLRLPIDELGRRRADARRAWLQNVNKPLDTAGILAE